MVAELRRWPLAVVLLDGEVDEVEASTLEAGGSIVPCIMANL